MRASGSTAGVAVVGDDDAGFIVVADVVDPELSEGPPQAETETARRAVANRCPITWECATRAG